MILIVTYDLKSHHDYVPLSRALLSFGPAARFMDSTWLLATDKPPAEVAAALRRLLGPEDTLFVTELNAPNPHAAYLPKRAFDWVAAHQSRSTNPAPKIASAPTALPALTAPEPLQKLPAISSQLKPPPTPIDSYRPKK